jgi:hypothetical protein
MSFKSQSGSWLGMVSKERLNDVVVIVFELVTSDTSQRYSLPPVTTFSQLMAHHGNMVEVGACMGDELLVPCSSILDLAFIIPMGEIESSTWLHQI